MKYFSASGYNQEVCHFYCRAINRMVPFINRQAHLNVHKCLLVSTLFWLKKIQIVSAPLQSIQLNEIAESSINCLVIIQT